jgi:hypothetical protein
MFKACESAGASSTARALFIHPGFICMRGTDGGYAPVLDEAKVWEAAEFREVWDIPSSNEVGGGLPDGVS